MFLSIYSFAFVSIEKIYQTLETVFHRLSKLLGFHQKCPDARHIFNSLLAVWKVWSNTVFRVWYINSAIVAIAITSINSLSSISTTIAIIWKTHWRDQKTVHPCLIQVLLGNFLSVYLKAIMATVWKLIILIDRSAFSGGLVVIELIMWRLLEYSAPFYVLFIFLGKWISGTIKKIGKALAPVRKYGFNKKIKQK